MRCKYLPQDLNARLNGGIAFYKGKAVAVSVDGTTINLYSFPDSAFITSIKEDDPDFDISSPTIGYVNDKFGCLYFFRRPDRKYKQTLTLSSLIAFDPVTEKFDNNYRIEQAYLHKNFVDMLENRYPSLDAALKTITTTKIKAQAINRDVALVLDSFGFIRVFFKKEQVGHIPENSRTVDVYKSEHAWVISKYLSEFNWTVV